VLAYWRAHAALCDSIVSWLPMEVHVLDVSIGSWAERRAELCTLLGIPCTEPEAPDPATLGALAGSYRDGDREITITLEDGGLILRGVLWASNRLIPVAPGVFDVEAWPFQVRFGEGTLCWSGPRLWWGGPGGVYERVATTDRA